MERKEQPFNDWLDSARWCNWVHIDQIDGDLIVDSKCCWSLNSAGDKEHDSGTHFCFRQQDRMSPEDDTWAVFKLYCCPVPTQRSVWLLLFLDSRRTMQFNLFSLQESASSSLWGMVSMTLSILEPNGISRSITPRTGWKNTAPFTWCGISACQTTRRWSES